MKTKPKKHHAIVVDKDGSARYALVPGRHPWSSDDPAPIYHALKRRTSETEARFVAMPAAFSTRIPRGLVFSMKALSRSETARMQRADPAKSPPPRRTVADLTREAIEDLLTKYEQRTARKTRRG